MPSAQRIELRPLAEVLEGRQARNAKLHPQEQVEALAASILEFGFLDPVLLDHGQVIAGHGRLAAAELLNLERIPVVPLDHLSEGQRRKFLLAANKLGETGWNAQLLTDELRALTGEGVDVGTLGWNDRELSRLLEESELAMLREMRGLEVPPDMGSSPDEPDRVPAGESFGPVKRPTVQPGDCWHLDGHRVLCADSTKREQLEPLLGKRRQVAAVVTDPPYAIFGSSTGAAPSVADDRMVAPFCHSVLELVDDALEMHGHAYVFCDWRSYPTWWQAMRGLSLVPKNLLVWDKGPAGVGSFWNNSHELVVMFARELEKRMSGQHRSGTSKKPRRVHGSSNVLRFDRVRGGAKQHSAQKPQALVHELVTNSTYEGERVLDPFAGSGTTLMACEEIGRACWAVDIEPGWAQLAIERWQRETDARALLNGKRGQTLEAVKARRRKKR